MDVGHQLPWLRDVTDDDGRSLNWRDTRRNHLVFLSQVLETTRFIAVQRPECETLDQPTGDWRSVR